MYQQLNIILRVLVLVGITSANPKDERTFNGWITMQYFIDLFQRCVLSSMSGQQFAIDDLKQFINYPSRTTVGSSNRFITNRKFFSNLISTVQFKRMLESDTRELNKNLVTKMKYCDSVVMDQELIKDFYDREIDQTKM